MRRGDLSYIGVLGEALLMKWHLGDPRMWSKPGGLWVKSAPGEEEAAKGLEAEAPVCLGSSGKAGWPACTQPLGRAAGEVKGQDI